MYSSHLGLDFIRLSKSLDVDGRSSFNKSTANLRHKHGRRRFRRILCVTDYQSFLYIDRQNDVNLFSGAG
jgi:hypothetical protein